MSLGPKREHIAICVCSNGRESLVDCLRAILVQEPPPATSMQLILVDNTGPGALAARMEESGLAGEVTTVHEPRPGIPMARNAALAAALAHKPDLIAFIDDDEIVSADWLPSLHAVLIKTGADVVQGRLVHAENFDEALARAASPRQKNRTPKTRTRRTASTFNVLFRSWLITSPLSLRFDENLNSMGEDTEFFMRASDAGALIIHTDAAPVFEAWPAERRTLESLRRRSWQGGASTNYRYRKNRAAPVAFGILVPRALWRAITGGVSMAASMLSGNPDTRKKAREKGNARLFFALGCISPYFGVMPGRYR